MKNLQNENIRLFPSNSVDFLINFILKKPEWISNTNNVDKKLHKIRF